MFQPAQPTSNFEDILNLGTKEVYRHTKCLRYFFLEIYMNQLNGCDMVNGQWTELM